MTALCLKCGTPFTRRQHGNDTLTFCSIRCANQFNTAKRSATTAAQFWADVSVGEPDECWPWTGAVDSHGYGQIRWHKKLCLSHRLALSLTDGDWQSRLLVCHSCDNPLCCNPTHLWRGTYRDNMQDMLKKCRNNQPKGEAHRSAKLTPEQVLVIRSSDEPTAPLSARYGVSFVTIQLIRRRQTWRHLP